MNGEAPNWQSWAALLVVAVTALAFLRRSLRRRKSRKIGCGQSCGCGK